MSQTELQNVYWIGGGSAAGKSTIAYRIAAERGLSVYSTDDVMADHARRSSPENCPLLHEFMATDMDERWVNRPPQLMFETFHWFRGEGLDLISEDLLRLPPPPHAPVAAVRSVPRLVDALVPASNRAVWLLPTHAFHESVVASRGGSVSGFLAKTSHPEEALRN